MFFSRKPKKSQAEIDAETLAVRKTWIGKTAVAVKTEEVAIRQELFGSVLHWSHFPTKTTDVSGVVHAVGLKSVKIGNQWYPLGPLQPGGVEIIEIVDE